MLGVYPYFVTDHGKEGSKEGYRVWGQRVGDRGRGTGWGERDTGNGVGDRGRMGRNALIVDCGTGGKWDEDRGLGIGGR